MAASIDGSVVGKDYRPPPGAPSKYWCYLIVDTDSGERVNIRLHQSIHEKFAIGDRVRFTKAWRANKRVRDVQRI